MYGRDNSSIASINFFILYSTPVVLFYDSSIAYSETKMISAKKLHGGFDNNQNQTENVW